MIDPGKAGILFFGVDVLIAIFAARKQLNIRH
jgi:hypothetical protein